jgi:hypothetical protein
MVFTLITFVARVSSNTADPRSFFLPYIEIIQTCVIAVLLWCILFVRAEPLLVRIALGLIGITLLGCIFTYRL